MTDFYWVGGAGPWDNASTANWSLSSGGAAGAGPPTAADNAIFDSNSGAGTVSVAETGTALAVTIDLTTLTVQLTGNVTFAGLVTLTAGTIDLTTRTLTAFSLASSNSNARTFACGTGQINLTGNNADIVEFTTVTNMVVTGTPVINSTYSGSTGARVFKMGNPAETASFSLKITAGSDTVQANVRFRDLDFTGFSGTSTGAGKIIYGSLIISPMMTWGGTASTLNLSGTLALGAVTSNGITIDQPINLGALAGTYRLLDALVQASGRAFTIGNGTLDMNGQNMTVGSFALNNNGNTRALAIGAGTLTCLGAFDAATNGTGFTATTSTGAISMTSASGKTFAGGGKTWPTLNQGGAGTLTITGANTFADITNSVNGTTVTLPASTITTVAALSLHGAVGSLTTLQSSSSGTPATLSKASGSVTASYLSIKDIAATGGALFRAPINQGNVNVSGNSGWLFGAAGAGGKAGIGMGLGLTL